MSLRLAIFTLSALLAVQNLWAGGSGLNVIVVVNQNSTNSVQLGNDYCELRGVPPQNLLRMTNWTGGAIQWAPDDFQTNLLNPLLGMISSRGLTQQSWFVVLSMDIPYRVQDSTGENGTTAALFYGFKTNGATQSSCSLPDNTSNSYAYSEMPFIQARPNTAATNSFLAMMLTDTNLTAAECTLRRAVTADDSYPTQTVCLAKTDDPFRNVRFTEFDNSVFENQVIGHLAVLRTNTDSTGFTNLAGLQTGLFQFAVPTNGFVPGALADTLTSYSGDLFEFEITDQTPVLGFLESGASASYGTVVEPCVYTQKFPDPVDYFYEARGFSLAEAYYQSLLNPFEGIFVGEPLAAPFARPGTGSWTSPTNSAVLSGQCSLTMSFAAAATNLPLAQADLFVDGTFFQTMTNLTPTAGNMLSVTVNGIHISYTVPPSATLSTIATGLANAMNVESAVTHVMAYPVGDRVELQYLNVSVPGSTVPVTATASSGFGAGLTTGISAARPAFLDSSATGYQFINIFNSPAVGDWLKVTFTKTNGTAVTLAVTNTTSGTTIGQLAQSLVNLINSTPALQSADGLYVSDFFDADPYGQAAVQFFVYAATPGWPASQILAQWSASSDLAGLPAGMNPLADNVGDLHPKNHLYISAGVTSLDVAFALDTTQLADGYHQLTAVAYEGTSVATQTRVTRNVMVQNTSLTATLASAPSGTNAAWGPPLTFTVIPNATNIARIELFGTGGSLCFVTNQATANFVVSTTFLGLGLHPFYAVVTDGAGHRFQTPTVWYRILPLTYLSVTGMPPVLGWAAVPAYKYDIQFTTNLLVPFQTITTLTASNSSVQWPLPVTGSTGFYRVHSEP